MINICPLTGMFKRNSTYISLCIQVENCILIQIFGLHNVTITKLYI